MVKNKYLKKARPWSFKDIMIQYYGIKGKFQNVYISVNKRKVEIFIKLQPTECSYQYKIKIETIIWEPKVNVFVVDPNISKMAKDSPQKIPHTYLNGSLCLFLPKNNEWNYYDSWADTLVPWASLWLYYYEIWLMTNEWLGGGVHSNNSEIKK